MAGRLLLVECVPTSSTPPVTQPIQQPQHTRDTLSRALGLDDASTPARRHYRHYVTQLFRHHNALALDSPDRTKVFKLLVVVDALLCDYGYACAGRLSKTYCEMLQISAFTPVDGAMPALSTQLLALPDGVCDPLDDVAFGDAEDVDMGPKICALKRVLSNHPGRTLLVVQRRASAKILNDFLAETMPDRPSACLMSSPKSPETERLMQSWRDGPIQIVISTGVPDPAIQIPECELVVMVDAAPATAAYDRAYGMLTSEGKLAALVWRGDKEHLRNLGRFYVDFVQPKLNATVSTVVQDPRKRSLDATESSTESTQTTHQDSITLKADAQNSKPANKRQKTGNDADENVTPYERHMPSVFRRDEMWSGLDDAEQSSLRTVEQIIKEPFNIGSQSESGANVEVHATFLDFDEAASSFAFAPSPVSQTRSFVVLTRRPIPSDVPDFEIFLPETFTPSTVRLVSTRIMTLSWSEWLIAREFHLRFFALVIRQQRSDNDEMTGADRVYKLLPTIRAENSDAYAIDWDFARAVVSFSTQQQPSVRDQLNSSPHNNLSTQVFFTPHNGLKYAFHAVRNDMTPHTEMEPETPDAVVQSFAQYFAAEHGLQTQDVTQPMLEVLHAPGIRNLLTPPRRTQFAREQLESQRRTLFLIPELTIVLPIDLAWFRLATLMPSIMAKIERFLIMYDFRRDLGVSGDGQVDLQSLYTALCTPSANEVAHNDRLETLGDSLLKYAVTTSLFLAHGDWDEGSLSAMRASRVSNRRLYTLGTKVNLGAFIFSMPFYPKQWAPPGITPWRPVTRRSIATKADVEWISDKMVADAVEALIGIYYLRGGFEMAVGLMKSLAVLTDNVMLRYPDPEPVVKTHVRFDEMEDGEVDREVVTEEIDEYAVETTREDEQVMTAEELAAVEHVERLLGYEFKSKRLALQALTHTTCVASPLDSYQRLELLGDAALDWCITRYFYHKFPNLQPGRLTDLRQTAVNNETFSRVTLHLGLHDHLWHKSSRVQWDVDGFVQWYNANCTQDTPPDQIKQEAPKILGDLFEALAGAVLIDTNFDIDLTCMSWVLEKHCLAQPIKNPVRAFHEHCQKNGLVDSIQIRFDVNPVDGQVICSIQLGDEVIARCSGNTNSVAKRAACAMALPRLESILIDQ